MAKPLGFPPLSREERQDFIEQFEKDLKFFQLFFLLMNKSAPIKKIDLVWAEDGPAGRVGLRRLMGTADALQSSCSRLLAKTDENPDPRFCILVNDHGRRETESCGVSDKAAEQRVRETGKPEVYRCHAGLVDIAVPVFSDGEHIATLLTGQVLPAAPSRSEFGRIGILICWDNWFPEAARVLRLKGAEIVFWPVEGDVEPRHWDIISRARAIDNGVYLIASSIVGQPSRILDPAGDILAETARPSEIATADLDLNRAWRVRHLSVGPALGEPRSLYVKERRPETYGLLQKSSTGR